MVKKIAVATNKGGVLKTSTAVNVASILAERGNDVLLVDTDGQGNTALTFGYSPDDFEDTIYDVLMNQRRIDEVIYKPIEDLSLSLIPANDDMSYFTLDILNAAQTKDDVDITKIINKTFTEVEQDYDYIIFDSPPTLDVIQANILNYVDSVLIPYQPEPYSMRSIQMFMKRVKQYQKTNSKLQIEGVLVTLFDSRTNTHNTNLIALAKFLEAKKIKMFDAVIKKTIKMSESIFNYRKPSVLVPKYSSNDVVKAYYLVADEIENNNN